jgi:hypothetical protein
MDGSNVSGVQGLQPTQQPDWWRYGIDSLGAAIATYPGKVNVVGEYQLNGVTLAFTALTAGTTGTPGSAIVLATAPTIGGAASIGGAATITGARLVGGTLSGAVSVAAGGSIIAPTISGAASIGGAATITGGRFVGGTLSGAMSVAAAGSIIGPTITGASSIGAGSSILDPNIHGTIAADNAAVGDIGEFVSNTSGALPLTTGVSLNTATLALTAGDWDVTGSVVFIPAAGTVPTAISAGPSLVTGTLPSFANGVVSLQTNFNTGTSQILAAGTQRVSLAATTNIWMVANAVFTVSTCTATGFLRARRVR